MSEVKSYSLEKESQLCPYSLQKILNEGKRMGWDKVRDNFSESVFAAAKNLNISKDVVKDVFLAIMFGNLHEKYGKLLLDDYEFHTIMDEMEKKDCSYIKSTTLLASYKIAEATGIHRYKVSALVSDIISHNFETFRHFLDIPDTRKIRN